MPTYTLPNGTRIFGPGVPVDYLSYDEIVANDLGDQIYAYRAAQTTITGGTGDDVLVFASVAIPGGSMSGGAGDDVLDASRASPYATSPTILDGGTGNDTIIGGGLNVTLIGDGIDSMTGSSVAGATNSFFLRNGQSAATDTVRATLTGGVQAHNSFNVSGNYNLIQCGNMGDAVLLGPTGFGYDTVMGGTGNDSFYDSGHDNTFISPLNATGNVTVWAQAANNDTITLGDGNNMLHLGGTDPNATTVVRVGNGSNTISAAGGQSALNVKIGRTDAPAGGSSVYNSAPAALDVIIGSNGTNTIDARYAPMGSAFPLQGSEIWMRGGPSADVLLGSLTGGNHFIGGGGGDTVQGGGYSAFDEFDFNNPSEGNLMISSGGQLDVFGISAPGFGGDLTAGEQLTVGYNLINGYGSVADTSTFLYNNNNLYFDRDGSGTGAPVLLATLNSTYLPQLSSANFKITGTDF